MDSLLGEGLRGWEQNMHVHKCVCDTYAPLTVCVVWFLYAIKHVVVTVGVWKIFSGLSRHVCTKNGASERMVLKIWKKIKIDLRPIGDTVQSLESQFENFTVKKKFRKSDFAYLSHYKNIRFYFFPGKRRVEGGECGSGASVVGSYLSTLHWCFGSILFRTMKYAF